MNQWTGVFNARSKRVVLARARYCARFFCRLRGLLFTSDLANGEGIIFIFAQPSRLFSAVHTFGMRYSIGIIWLDKRGLVVDKAASQARRWVYLPKSPAKFCIEAKPVILDYACIGDMLLFDKEPS